MFRYTNKKHTCPTGCFIITGVWRGRRGAITKVFRKTNTFD